MELLYVVCQIAAADVCETRRMTLRGAVPIACIATAEGDLPHRLRPGWTLARWRCAPLDRTPDPATLAAG